VGDPERAVMEEMKEEDEVLSHYSLLTPRNQDFVLLMLQLFFVHTERQLQSLSTNPPGIHPEIYDRDI
jgi:hypothetical protein